LEILSRRSEQDESASSRRPGSATRWNLAWNQETTTQAGEFDAVIAALPAPALAQLRFGASGERALASLDTIEHPPVSSLFPGFRRGRASRCLDRRTGAGWHIRSGVHCRR
jgi:predicted NAD/FAD-dependent oxidoreductase